MPMLSDCGSLSEAWTLLTSGHETESGHEYCEFAPSSSRRVMDRDDQLANLGLYASTQTEKVAYSTTAI